MAADDAAMAPEESSMASGARQALPGNGRTSGSERGRSGPAKWAADAVQGSASRGAVRSASRRSLWPTARSHCEGGRPPGDDPRRRRQ